ncbi:MAG: AsmA family protein [Micavibrio sp.]|nr:AsmA family protein [Micavibrio sp.]
MKKFAIFLLVLVLLIGGGIFAATRFISKDEVQKRVIAAVKEKTGRDLAFSDMRLGFFPNIGLRLQNVTFSNASWAGDKTMVSLNEMNLGLALKPLFSKQIEVTRFVLDKPVIHLEVAADGRKNWEFSQLKDKEDAKTTKGDAAEGAPKANLSSDLGFKFSEFQIKDGALSFTDRQKGTTVLLENIGATVKYPDLASAIQLDGTALYNKKKVNVFASIENPIDFLNGKASPGKLSLKTDDFKAVVDGSLATAGTMLAGSIETEISSLANTVAWATGGKPQEMPFEKVSFSSKAQASASELKLVSATLALDDVTAKGNVTLGYGGAKPTLNARVSVNKLNLDRFTGGKKDGGDAKDAAPAKTASPQAGWDAKPIDFSGLKAVNADLVLQTEGFSLRGADVGPSTLTVNLQDGNLHAKSSEATLFSGKFSSDVTVNAAAATPALAFHFNMKDVQAKPVLTTFADFKKLSGTVDANVDVTSTGRSQQAIVNALAGTGSFLFKNGALEGIDLVNVAKMIQSRLGEMGVGEGKTEFVDLGGTFVITAGVAHNSDLKLRGPLVQSTGAGDINLPQKRVDYRVLPVLTASSAVDGAKGITVPVDIKGPFSDIKVKPDYKGAVQGLLDNPEDAKAAAKNVRDQGKTILKDIKKDPKAALGNLLGGGLFGKKPAATAPVTDGGATAPATP